MYFPIFTCPYTKAKLVLSDTDLQPIDHAPTVRAFADKHAARLAALAVKHRVAAKLHFSIKPI